MYTHTHTTHLLVRSHTALPQLKSYVVINSLHVIRGQNRIPAHCFPIGKRSLCTTSAQPTCLIHSFINRGGWGMPFYVSHYWKEQVNLPFGGLQDWRPRILGNSSLSSTSSLVDRSAFVILLSWLQSRFQWGRVSWWKGADGQDDEVGRGNQARWCMANLLSDPSPCLLKCPSHQANCSWRALHLPSPLIKCALH